jgi:two-component sensor histidine kinase
MDIVYSWVKEHEKGNTIMVPNVSDYKSEDKVKEILEEQNIKSIVTVPMVENNKCLGFVGFDSVLKYKTYNKDEISLLKLYAQTILDIRNREKKESELLSSLEEKSILMKEIHHRVKNNLQLVSSLIYLQSCYIDDTKVKKALKDMENRIKSMAVLHEKIYNAEEISKINFKEYIESIIKELLKYYKSDKKIKFYADIDNVELNIDKSLNCGLIINELVTNSIQHGFKNKESGEIRVKIKEINDLVLITIYDNGEGFNEEYEKIKDNSLGLKIVESLTKQLKGTIRKEEVKGTKFLINFKK